MPNLIKPRFSRSSTSSSLAIAILIAVLIRFSFLTNIAFIKIKGLNIICLILAVLIFFSFSYLINLCYREWYILYYKNFNSMKYKIEEDNIIIIDGCREFTLTLNDISKIGYNGEKFIEIKYSKCQGFCIVQRNQEYDKLLINISGNKFKF